MSVRHFLVAGVILTGAVLSGSAPTSATTTGDQPEATAGVGTTLGADTHIRLLRDTVWIGDDERGIRNGQQTVRREFRRRGGLNAFVRIENDSATPAEMTVRGSRGNGNFSVRYFTGGSEITREVVSGEFTTPTVDSGAATYVRVRIATKRTQRKGAAYAARITARSDGPGSGDTVRAVLDDPRFSDAQVAAAGLVNDTRTAANRSELPLDFQLSERAQTWSDYMAATGVVENSGMFWGLPDRWRSVGEIVGSGATLRSAHDALVADRGDHLKMLSNWTIVGTGVSSRSGTVYLVQVFLLS